MTAFSASPVAIDLIKRNEGCRLTAYLDQIADPPIWTIGYGMTGPDVRQGMVISQQQAEDGLRDRLAREFEPAVNKAIGEAPTTQNQFDAMVSLAWNIGAGAFGQSSVLHYHRAGDYQRAADAFLLWHKAGGKIIPALVRRREEERALYLSEVASVAADDEQSTDLEIDLDLLANLICAVQRVVGTTPDGIFGPKTAAAISAAQRQARR